MFFLKIILSLSEINILMKRKLLLFLALSPFFSFCQKIINQPVYSGAVSNSNISYVVGKIYVVPVPDSKKTPEAEISDTIIIYPNPVTSDLYFETKDQSILKTIIIYGMDGKLVYSNQITNNSVNLSFLVSGAYIIKFDDNLTNYKIIKK
jgi:hypothetical protein